eukprot:1682418-Rhodomonas_salina.3
MNMLMQHGAIHGHRTARAWAASGVDQGCVHFSSLKKHSSVIYGALMHSGHTLEAAAKRHNASIIAEIKHKRHHNWTRNVRLSISHRSIYLVSQLDEGGSGRRETHGKRRKEAGEAARGGKRATMSDDVSATLSYDAA